MRTRYLLCFFLLAQQLAHAQAYELAALGAAYGLNALQKKPQNPNEYVTTLAYKGKAVLQKRTPSDKLKGKGVAEIARVEAALALCAANLMADDLKPICTDQQYFDLALAIKQIPSVKREWNVTAYDAENDFYRSENYLRTQRREQVAREQARSLQAAKEAKERRSLDSTYQIAQRAIFTRDSSVRVAQARRQAYLDSVNRPQNEAYTRELNMALLTPAGRRLFEASERPKLTNKVHVRRTAVGSRVYICGGGSAYAYHSSSSCSGLNRCSAGVSAVSMATAQSMGRTPCKKCH